MARGRKPGESREMLIAALAGGAKVQKDLMRAIGVTSRGTITRILSQLHRDGLVERGFSLTPAGRAALENDHV